MTSGSSLPHRYLMGLDKRPQGFQSVAFCSRPAPLRKPVKKALVAYWARVDLRPRHCLVLHLQIFPQGPTPDVGIYRVVLQGPWGDGYHLPPTWRLVAAASHSAPAPSVWRFTALGFVHGLAHMPLFTRKPWKTNLGVPHSAPTGNPCAPPLHFASRWVPRAVSRGGRGGRRKNFQSAPPSLPGIQSPRKTSAIPGLQPSLN